MRPGQARPANQPADSYQKFDAARCRSLHEFTLDKFGKLDFLVNNGGGQFPCGAADMTLKGWNAVVETNLTGTYLMCREAHRQYMGEHGGAIVNIIADMFRGFPMMSHTGEAGREGGGTAQ